MSSYQTPLIDGLTSLKYIRWCLRMIKRIYRNIGPITINQFITAVMQRSIKSNTFRNKIEMEDSNKIACSVNDHELMI